MKLKAILFDVDGTLAETEEAHRVAFNRAFAEAGKEWRWSQDETRELLQITGGRERLAAYVSQIGETLAPDDLATLHRRKNVLYSHAVADGAVPVRPGVARLIAEARSAGVRLGIATSTSRQNLLPLLECLFGRAAEGWFDVISTGDHVRGEKA